MDASTARWLVSGEAADALLLVAGLDAPGSLASASLLRETLPADRAAAVAAQEQLRRRAESKWAVRAHELWWTPAGLEQATRATVARRRAERLRTRGASHVVDLTCGLGLDALAMLDAGLAVDAVELDEVTAVLAAANLPGAVVQQGDAVALAPALLEDGASAYIDPARRTSAGRTWRVEDFTPSWPFVLSILDGSRLACAKLGPGLPHNLIPDGVEAEWISDRGTVVEAGLWAGPGSSRGLRRAVVDGHELEGDGRLDAPLGDLDDVLIEPDGAVIRAGLVGLLAERLDAHRVGDTAYLSGRTASASPFATAFAVRDVMPFKEKVLRSWVREHRVGVLEIKKRGVDADPALLRKRLKPSGPESATLIIAPTASGTVAIVADRVRDDRA